MWEGFEVMVCCAFEYKSMLIFVFDNLDNFITSKFISSSVSVLILLKLNFRIELSLWSFKSSILTCGASFTAKFCNEKQYKFTFRLVQVFFL